MVAAIDDPGCTEWPSRRAAQRPPRPHARRPGRSSKHRSRVEGDDADAGLEAGHAAHRRGQATGTGLQLARRHGVRRGVARSAEQDRLPGRALRERMPRADPVAHVEVGPRRLDDREGERLLTVGDREVRGAADRLGELAEHGDGEVAQHRLHGRAEPQHAEAEPQPAARVAADECVLLEGADEPVHDRPVDLEPGGELGDGEAVGRRRQHVEDPEPAVQGLRGLGRHGPSLGIATTTCGSPTRGPVDPRVQLVGGRDRRRRPAALLAQRRVGDAVRLAGAVVPGGDQPVELAAQHRELLVGARPRRPSRARAAAVAFCFLARSLCRCWSSSRIWSGSSRPGMPRKSISSSEPTCTSPAWPNSPPSKSTRSKRASEPSASKDMSSSSEARLAGVRLGEQVVLGGEDVALVVDLAAEHVVALDLHLGGEAEQVAAPTAGTPTPSRRGCGPARSGRRPGRRTAASRSSWRRRRPRAAGTSTPSDTIRTATIHRLSLSVNSVIFFDARLLVGEHHGGGLAGDLLEDLGVGARRVLVGGDHQAAGVRDVPAHLGQPAVGGGEHRRDPRARSGRARCAAPGW